jgi:2-phosphoglycerate kinase
MTPGPELDEAPWMLNDPSPIVVGDGPGAPPFMAGILVSSLVARGVPFPVAYTTAGEVERQFRKRAVLQVQATDITAAVREILGEDPRTLPEPDDHDILIVGPGGGLPFSKGILSQSLLAAAVNPRDAFETARNIEHELVTRNQHTIERSSLRSLAHQALKERAGDEAAARYLAWRRYEEPERPVVILLGGTSGVGKTTLALEVARRMGIGRVLSTDSIRQVMRLMISRDLMPWIHASSYDAHTLLPSSAGRRASVLDGFRAQASSVAVGVHASLDRSVEESANVVVDGVSLLPGGVDLERYKGRAIVVFCVIAALDESALRDRFQSRASGQRQRLAHRYLENFDGILEIQRHLIDEANLRNMLVVDNVDLDRAALQVIAHVLDTVRREGRTIA